MKNSENVRSKKFLKHLGLLCTAALVIPGALPSASAATYYWDSNGTSSGFGTATGTWTTSTVGSATQGWSTDSTGVTLPGTVTTVGASDILNFGTATSALNTGTVTITGTVSAANITVGASGNPTITLSGGTIDMGSTAGLLTLNGSLSISSVLTGTNGLTKTGAGQLRLNTAATYTGNTTLSGGTTIVGTTNAMPTGTTLIMSGTANILNAGTNQSIVGLTGVSGNSIRNYQGTNYTLTITNAGNTTYAGTIIDSNTNGGVQGSTNVVLQGGTQTLSGASYYRGTTTVGGGTLIAGANSAATAITNFTSVTATSGSPTFALAGNPLVNGNLVVFTGSTLPAGIGATTQYFVVNATATDFQVSTTFGGAAITPTTAGLAVTVSQQLTGSLGSGNSAVVLGNAGTTTGNLSPSLLTGGAFNIGRAITIANQATTGTYTIGGNTANASTFSGLVTANKDFTVSQVTGGTVNVTGGITGASAGTKTVTFNNVGAVNVSTTGITDGATGNVALSQTGAGTTTISATSSYTGATAISAGTLLLAADISATSSVGVSGGSLKSNIANVNLGVGALTMNSGAINPGDIGTAGTFTLAANQNITTTGGTFNFDLGTTVDQIVGSGTGTFTLTGTTLALNQIAGFNYGSTYTVFSGFNSAGSSSSGLTITGYDTTNYTAILSNAGVLSFTAVPEPSTYALLGSGLASLWFLRRRKKTSV